MQVDLDEIKFKKVRRVGKWKTATQAEIDAENERRKAEAFADTVMGNMEEAYKKKVEEEEEAERNKKPHVPTQLGNKVKVLTHILGMRIGDMGVVTGYTSRELPLPAYEGTVIVKFEDGEEELFDDRDLEVQA